MKYFVLVFCCCLFWGTAQAQQLVGIKGGYGLHNIRAVPSMRIPQPEQKWVQGLSGGIVFRTLNSQHLGLQMELLVEQKGWHLLPGTPDAYRIEEQHLSLPIQSVVMIGRGNVQLVVSGGAFAAYIMKEEEFYEEGAGAGYPVKFRRQSNQDWHYGLLGGLGPALRIGRSWLQLEGRFSYTLSNRLEPNLTASDAFNISNQQSVTFALTWLTQLGAIKDTK